jgi:uncharacterized protein (TIGR03083 family)
MVRGPLGGAELTLEQNLRLRVFDVWVHEQDLRRALDSPGNLDSPSAVIARDMLLEALPKVVAHKAGAPAYSAVVIDVHGPLEFLRTVRVDADGKGSVSGSPSLGPVVTLTLDWEAYMLLACGRARPEALGSRVKTEGDQDLALAILRSFATTP